MDRVLRRRLAGGVIILAGLATVFWLGSADEAGKGWIIGTITMFAGIIVAAWPAR